MREYIIAVFAVLYLRFLGLTSKIRYFELEDPPKKKPFIYVTWHKHSILHAYLHKGKALRFITSTSRDGDITANAIPMLGFKVLRGTSANRRDAFKGTRAIIKTLKDGHIVAVTPDGPKGPALVVKNGIPVIAKKLQVPVIPTAWAVTRSKVLDNWDNTILPFPFNKAVLVNGKSIMIDKDEDIETAKLRIKKAMDETCLKAEELVKTI